MKYEISEIIKRIGFDEQRIQVNGLIGGIYIKKITYEYAIQSLKQVMGTNSTLQGVIEKDHFIWEIKEIYKSVDRIVETDYFKHSPYHNFEDKEPFDIASFIKFNYDQSNFKGLISINEIMNILGDEFIKKANDNYFLALKKYKMRRDKIKSKRKNKKTKGLIYLIKIDDREQYKIGVTTNLEKRMDQLGTKMPFKLEIINVIKSKNIYALEKKLHNKFENENISGEWFILGKKDIEYIKSIKDEY